MLGNRRQRAFTLVELLIVIVIIGMLVALLLPAVGAVMRSAQEFRVGTEIAKLGQAVEQYKTKYGDYPPDFSELYGITDPDVITMSSAFNSSFIIRHLRKAFPKISPAEVGNFKAYLAQEIAHGHGSPDPSTALYFWLGGLSANVQRPFTGAGGPIFFDTNAGEWRLRRQDRESPLFAFDEDQVIFNDDETLAYYQPNGYKAPFVYFDNDTYVTARFDYKGSIAVPYVKIVSDKTNPPSVNFAQVNTFQIISAGKDDAFAPLIPTQNGFLYTTDDGRPFHPNDYPNPLLASPNQDYGRFFEGQEDNLTNFSDSKRLVTKQES
jgi:prepilin-type N-terminal cleavage/methylation domain-containing protein